MSTSSNQSLSADAATILKTKKFVNNNDDEISEWNPDTKMTLWSWRLRWSTTSNLVGVFFGQASDQSALGIKATLEELVVVFQPLVQLTILRLNNNLDVTGEPQSLAGMTSLKELNLSRTGVSGQNGLVGLEHLVCSEGARLQYFELNGLTNLSGLIPTAMTREPKFRLQIEGTALRSEMKEVSLSVAQFPFTVVPSEALLRLDRLCKHEEAKLKGQVIWANMTKNPFSVWYMNNNDHNYVQARDLGSLQVSPHSPTLASSTASSLSASLPAVTAATRRATTAGSSGIRGVYVSRNEVAFISHRWLDGAASDADGGAHPDDKNNSKLKHLQKLVLKHPEIRYWWVDFMCVPQQDSEATMTAIFSLPHYVKCCSKFFVLVDESHTNDRYHQQSWNGSGWCRLERLAACAPFEADIYRSGSLSPLFIEATVSRSDDLSETSLTEADPTSYEPLDGTFWDDADVNKLDIDKDRFKIKPVRDVLMGMISNSSGGGGAAFGGIQTLHPLPST